MNGLRRWLPLVVVLTVACGGGGSGGGGVVAPSLLATFTADQPSPSAGSSAMASGGAAADTVTVLVNVTGISGLRSASFDILFDDAALDFVASTSGMALEQSGQTPLYVTGANSGILTVAVSLPGPGSVNVNGTQALVGLTFRAGRAGSYPLSFQGPILLNGSLQPISATWHAGTLSAN